MAIRASEGLQTVSRARVVFSQVLACLALDFLLIGLGMSISFVTMVLPEVMDAQEGLSITKKQASWFGSLAFLCQPLGSLFSGPLLDHFGRKKALFLVNIPHVIAWILMYYAWNVPSLFIGNALLGIGTGIMEAPSITYVGEVSDPRLRGILTTLTNMFTSAGMFIAYLLGTVLKWRQAALVALIIPLSTMFLVLFVNKVVVFVNKIVRDMCSHPPKVDISELISSATVPETPIWLLSKGRQKEALRSLCRLRGWVKPENVKEEFDTLILYNDVIHQCVICMKDGKDIHACEHTNASLIKRIALKFKHILFVKETMRPFALVMAYFLFHTMSGLAPVKPNMVNLCSALGMKYDAKTVVVFIGATAIFMNILSAVIVKAIGKRKLVLGALLGTAFCSLGISVYSATSLSPDVFSYEAHTFPKKGDVVPVVLFMALVCFTSLGIPWVLLSEVFPFRSRGVAISIAAALSYVIYFLSSKTNYNIEASLHLSGTFAIYATFGFVGAIYLYLFLPETESKTLVEIEALYKGEKRIFADDFLINAILKKNGNLYNGADKPMLVK